MSTMKFLGGCSVFLALLALDLPDLDAAYAKKNEVKKITQCPKEGEQEDFFTPITEEAIRKCKEERKREDKRAIPTPICVKQHWNPSAQFLYWSTNYNLPFSIALSEVTETLPATTTETFTDNFVASQIVRTKQTWSPGVRLGMGYDSDVDRLDFQLFWTYYYNHADKHLSATGTTMQNIFFGAYGTVHGSMKLHYNVADAEVGKTYRLSRHIFIRPFLSARASWIAQENFVHFDDNIANFVVTTGTRPNVTNTAVSVDQPLEIELDFDVWGLGPRVGFNTNWGNYQGFSLLGNISAALLYGKSRTKLHLDNISTGQTTSGGSVELPVEGGPVAVNFTDFKAKDKYWQLFPNLQLLMGLSWGHCFNHGKNSLRINAGWETNFLWETTNVLFFDRAISFQGLTLDLNFGF